MHTISSSKTVEIFARGFSYAGEITIRTHTALCDKLCPTGSVVDLVCNFPSLVTIAQSMSVISILSDIILSSDVDREFDTVTLTIGVGFDFQSEPDFKFSDPYSDVDDIVNEALSIFDSIK